MDPWVEQLKDCCRQFPTRAKWVLVPTHFVGHTLGERLDLERTNSPLRSYEIREAVQAIRLGRWRLEPELRDRSEALS